MRDQEKDMLLTRDTLPETIFDIAALDELLCRPSQALIDDLQKVDGDIMILGVAGKMGPTLAGLAKAAQPGRRIIGVARFSDPSVKPGSRPAASRRLVATCSTRPRSRRCRKRKTSSSWPDASLAPRAICR